jgi:hypothetical protein
MTMDTASVLREQLKDSHDLLESTLADVTAEQAHWSPPGKANPLGASYAHVLMSEDMVINGLLRKQAPLAMGSWAGKLGVSEPHPAPGQDWNPWARNVKIDLDALKEYGQAVFAASDEYLAALTDSELEQGVDLSGFGLGEKSTAWVLGNVVIAHVGEHCGEISCLKGLQGAKGYPF